MTSTRPFPHLAVPVLALALGALWGVPARADVPSTFRLQGRLLDSNGVPISGTRDVRVSLYAAATGGTALWTELHSTTFDAGYFVIGLGTTTPFPASLWSGPSRYAGITVGTDPEMTPREEFSSVPYALVSRDVLGDIHPNSVSIGGSVVIDSSGRWVGSTAGLQGPAGPTGPTGPAGASPFTLSGSDAYFLGGRIGIGVNAPAAALDVVGSAQASTNFTITGGQLQLSAANVSYGNPTAANARIGFNSGGASLSYFAKNPDGVTNFGHTFDVITAPSTGGLFSIRSAGADKVVVDRLGRVGIGTSAPTAKLEVAGTAGTDGIKFPDGTLQTSAVPAGAVMYFNLAACPTGWTELTAAQGRYIVGVPSGGTLGGTAGTALSNQEDRPVGQHSHGISDPGHSHSSTLYEWQFGAPGGSGVLFYTRNSNANMGAQGASPGLGSSGTGVTVNNAGGVAGTNAPYLQLRVCQKN